MRLRLRISIQYTGIKSIRIRISKHCVNSDIQMYSAAFLRVSNKKPPFHDHNISGIVCVKEINYKQNKLLFDL